MVNYSKWDNIGDSSDEEAPAKAAPPAKAVPAGEEPIGEGFCSGALDASLTAEHVLRAMRVRAAKPQLFEPVVPGQGYEVEEMLRYTRQVVTFGAGSELADMRPKVTHVYDDAKREELRCVDVDASGAETDGEVVHALLRDPLRIAHFERSVSTGKRRVSAMPTCVVEAMIAKTAEIAARFRDGTDESGVAPAFPAL